MKITKAILFGILFWVLVFFEVSVLMFGLKLTQNSTSYYLTHLLLLVIITIVCSLLYFRKTKTDAREGIKLGIIFLIVGLILDATITVPLFVKDYSFFFRTDLLIGYLTILITTIVVGTIRK